MTLFYCDDDYDDLAIFTECIKEISPNIKCITTHDPEASLAYLSEGQNELPDIIFLDVNMPKMSGLELLRWLGRVESLKGIPIIMHTTNSDKKQTDQCLALGATEVVNKLYSPESIKARLREVLNRYSSALSA